MEWWKFEVEEAIVSLPKVVGADGGKGVKNVVGKEGAREGEACYNEVQGGGGRHGLLGGLALGLGWPEAHQLGPFQVKLWIWPKKF